MIDNRNVYYLDANFLIAIMLKNHKWSKKAAVLFAKLLKHNSNLQISALALDEAFYRIKTTINKQLPDRQKRPIAYYANNYYMPFIKNINDTPFLHTVQFDDLDRGIMNAVENIKDFNLDPRDAFHLALMQDIGIKSIVTNNKKDFKKIPGINRVPF